MELRGIFYNASGIAARRSPTSYLVSGSPILNVYGWSIPFSVTLSEQERSFRQPFNQFGLSPTYKWITLHAGYRNITFNPFTLAGHTMLGAGVELNPGKWRAGFVYGRFNRATVIDTTTQALVPFSFSRKGYAAKLGYGTARNYFDLSFLKAKDDSTTRPNGILPDALNVLPEANAVLGYSSRLGITKSIYFESDGAVSLYTRDINSIIQIGQMDNTFLDKMKDYFLVNGSSEYFTALHAALGYREKNYGLKLSYRRIDPDYKTMGAYFFANDIENWTVAPSYSTSSGRVRLNASVGIQRDNIRDQKEATNRRFIGSGMLSADLTKELGLDLNYSNFSNNQRPNTLRFADSLKIVQTTQVLGIMPRYTLIGADISHILMLSANFSTMKDYNTYFAADAVGRDINTNQYLLSYTASFPKKNLSLSGSLNYTDLSASGISNQYQGVSFGGNYSFSKNKAQVGMNNSVLQGRTEQGKSLIINSSANFSYRIDKLQSLRALFFLTNNNPGSALTGMNPAFTETRGELAYQLNF